MRTEIRIGTSGWHYKHWLGTFYPPGTRASKMLDYYLERFDTVEINNSFYRLPEPETFAAWREAVPRDFRFAVKGSRFLTHAKKLKDPEQGIERFFANADLLGDKLGAVLWQLPPQWGVNVERLDAFLEALPRHHRYAFEFRHESWNTDAVYAVLRKHGAAYCIYHLAGFQSPLEITADFTYLRLHGPGGKYQGSYDDGMLRRWAALIQGWNGQLRAVYAYFDNDQAGFAAHNAARLRQLVSL